MFTGGQLIGTQFLTWLRVCFRWEFTSSMIVGFGLVVRGAFSGAESQTKIEPLLRV